MEIRQLRTFRVLADTLSFTKTAEKIFMAQSSVSAQIQHRMIIDIKDDNRHP